MKDAVARGVHDGETRSNVLLAKFFDDLGSRGGLVADGLAADGAFERLDDFGREAVSVDRKCLRQPNPGHLPVPGGRIFPWGMRDPFAKAPFWAARRL